MIHHHGQEGFFFVQTWTGRIALIAYVLGGWLLPLLHDHDSHQHAAESCVAVASKAVNSADSSCHAGHSHAGHSQAGHSHGPAGDDHPTTEHKLSSSTPAMGTAPPVAIHDHGLCSLCVSRSINGHHAPSFPTVLQSIPSINFSARDLPPCVQPKRATDLSRGPPCNV